MCPSDLMSISPQPAISSTAPSAACGIHAIGAVKNSRIRAMTSAAMMPTSWLLPPTMSLTAVRESAPLMAKPWETPAARLLTPRATNSWLALIA
ncbi:hypothetical protein D3C75_930710 [compost metagenome]